MSVGSVVFLLVSTNTVRLTDRLPRKPVIVVSALLMGLTLVPVLNVTRRSGSRSGSSVRWRALRRSEPPRRAHSGSLSCRTGPAR